MLNPELKLNANVFDLTVEKKSTRAGFGEGLVRAADANKNVLALSADLSDSIGLAKFKEKYPKRYIEVGVAEQNLITVASGMAAAGKIPFATSYAVFSPGRTWEQIRTTICYNNLPVKIIGSHVGVTVGPDGGSHQALEDMAMMRVLPRMTVISPCDVFQACKAVMAAAVSPDPTYIRLSRPTTAVITSEETPFTIGQAQIVFDSRASATSITSNQNPTPVKNSLANTLASFAFRNSTKSQANSANNSGVNSQASSGTSADVALIATGPILYQALLAAKNLTTNGKRVIVVNVHTVKPLDVHTIINVAQMAGAIVTVEDHQIAGGLGSAVAECLAQNFPVPIEFVGVKDKFGQSGTPEELLNAYELTDAHVVEAVQRVLIRK